MKKIILPIVLVVLVVPQIAFASWWNPFSWSIFHWNNNSNTEVLEKRIVELEEQINNITTTTSTTTEAEYQKLVSEQKAEADKIRATLFASTTAANVIKQKAEADKIRAALKAGQDALVAKPKVAEQSIAPVVVSSPVVVDSTLQRRFRYDGRIDLSWYNLLNVLDYIKNPKASLGKPVQIENGIIVGFNQTLNNYIEVMDGKDTSSHPKFINFRVVNDNDYTLITNSLVEGDRVLIYGFGVSNVKFDVVGNGGSYESYEPAIEVDAVYKCNASVYCQYAYEAGVKSIFEKKLNK